MKSIFPRAALLGMAGALAAAPLAAQETPPAPMASRPLAFPAFRETRLPNGMGLIVVENRSHPVANLYLVLRSGAASVSAAQAGTAELLAETLTKGTTTRSARQIAEAIEGTGGSLNAFSSNDNVGVAATVLSEHLPLAMELVSEVVQRPSFPEDEVQTAKQRALSTLQSQLGQPAAIATRRLLREVYGTHPYGITRTPATVTGLGPAQLREFHARAFKPANAILVVAGDVRAAQVEEMARRHFGAWTGSAPAAPAFAPLPARSRTGITLIHRPGSVQSSLRVGFPGIRPDNADYYPLLVLDKLLGGGADARLFQILREQKGWTYGAYTSVTRPVDMGYIAASAEVRTAVTDSAMSELLRQLKRVRDEPVTQVELEAAKGFLVGSFPGSVETPAQVASQVATTRLLGLPIDALLRYRERVGAVTVADVQRVARKYVTPDQAAVVVVGDAAKVLPQLEAIAPVTLLDLQGNPLGRGSLEVRASSERHDMSRLRPATLTYRVMAGGNPVATQTTVLAREGAGWTRTATVKAGPMTQTLTTRWGADFAPVSYSEKVEGPVSGEASAQLTAGRIKGQSKLPPQMGGEKTFDAEAVAGSVFDGTDEAILMVADLAPGKTITLPVFTTSSGAVGNHSYKVVAAEQVTTPAGAFPAFKLEVTGKQQPMTVWVRQEAPHIPLRYEVTGAPVVVELQEMK
jgi:predicted Zn-dependent peptidase